MFFDRCNFCSLVRWRARLEELPFEPASVALLQPAGGRLASCITKPISAQQELFNFLLSRLASKYRVAKKSVRFRCSKKWGNCKRGCRGVSCGKHSKHDQICPIPKAGTTNHFLQTTLYMRKGYIFTAVSKTRQHPLAIPKSMICRSARN